MILNFVSEDDEENEFYLNNGVGTFPDERRIIAARGITNGVASGSANSQVKNGGQGQIRLP